jgi:hypothetical protein
VEEQQNVMAEHYNLKCGLDTTLQVSKYASTVSIHGHPWLHFVTAHNFDLMRIWIRLFTLMRIRLPKIMRIRTKYPPRDGRTNKKTDFSLRILVSAARGNEPESRESNAPPIYYSAQARLFYVNSEK